MYSAIHHNTASQHTHGAHCYASKRTQMCYDTDPLSLGSQGPEPFTPLSHIKYYYCIHILCHEKSWKDCIIEQLDSVHEKQEPEAIYLTTNSFSSNFIAI